MNKRKPIFICCMVCALAVVLTLTVYSIYDNGDGSNDSARIPAYEDYLNFAKASVAETIDSGNPMCIWNDTTSIDWGLPLYDYTSACNGYVFMLTTNGEPSGYMQVSYIGGEMGLCMYCFKLFGKSDIAEYDDIAKYYKKYVGKVEANRKSLRQEAEDGKLKNGYVNKSKYN